MKRCPIAAKIAGSIGILPRCALSNVFTYDTLYNMGNLVPAYAMYTYFPVVKKKKMAEIKALHHTDFEAAR